MEKHLKQIFGDRFKKNEILAKHTNFRIGGQADFFVEVINDSEVEEAVKVAEVTGVPYFILGGGSNVLISDDGFRGLVIKIANRNVQIDGTTVTAGAGAMTSMVAGKVIKNGLTGLEWAVTIPGTIAGAVVGNAGCHGSEIRDVVKSVKVLRQNEIVELSKEDCNFQYRESIFKSTDNNDVILEVVLELEECDSEICKQKADGFIAKRKEAQPFDNSSAGCIFKNFTFKNDDQVAKLNSVLEVPGSMLANKSISAGWLVDQLGLKGIGVGDAVVSDKHGNFILNKGQATAKDVLELISLIKQRAHDRVGVELKEEVRYLGLNN